MRRKHGDYLEMYNVQRLMTLVVSPFQRFSETPWWGRVVAPIGAFLSAVWRDWFTPLLLILMVSHYFDYRFGVRAAKANDDYDPQLAEYGWHSKMAGILLAMLIRSAEWWATSRVPGVDTHGALAVTFALALLSKDMETITYHRERLGAGPIPIMGVILAWMRRVSNALLPPGMEDHPQERERDMHDEEEP